jgi:hypothetical protein
MTSTRIANLALRALLVATFIAVLPTIQVDARASGNPALQAASTAGNRTASITLPEGWQITQVDHGALAASGPGGTTVYLGYTIPGIYDTVNPAARQAAMLAGRAHTPFILCPYGGDLATSYRCVLQQLRKNEQLPAATLHVAKYPAVPTASGETNAVLIQANVYSSDTGTRAATIRIGITGMSASGQWTMTLNSVAAPQQLINQQLPALREIISSYRQNGRSVPAITDAILNGLLAQRPAPLPNAGDINPPR